MNKLVRTKNLDLGCGANPRNPYNFDELYGVDIVERHDSLIQDFHYKSTNVILEKIPFEDNFFDSVSAFDFIEHVPRLICNNGNIIFPFIELMNEIYRVLKPGGKFYAITPVFPKESVFVDPTHVNFLTINSFKYFTIPHCWASIYGFTGEFKNLRNEVVNFDLEVNSERNFFARTIKKVFVGLYPKAKQHVVWEFEGIKID
jgi:SAM-dependent methyltransferase